MLYKIIVVAVIQSRKHARASFAAHQAEENIAVVVASARQQIAALATMQKMQPFG